MADARTGVKMTWATARTMRVIPKIALKPHEKEHTAKPRLHAPIKKPKP